MYQNSHVNRLSQLNQLDQLPAPQSPLSEGCAEWMSTLLASEGSAAHRYLCADRLLQGAKAAHNIADIVHFLVILHGRAPSFVDGAARKMVDSPIVAWLAEASSAWTYERELLLTIAAMVGAVPSTAGQQQCEAVAAEQYRALTLLVDSDRRGCALGAVTALLYDWQAIRAVLDKVAHRLQLSPPICVLPRPSGIATLADDYIVGSVDSPAVDRAFAFGARQALRQHSGLWDLLKVRQQLRLDNPL